MTKFAHSILLMGLALTFSNGCQDSSGTEETSKTVAIDKIKNTSDKVPAPKPGGITIVNVDAKAAAALVDQKEVVVLDVRTQEEYDRGHVAGAVLTDILAEGFETKVAALPHEKPYLVHCMSGVAGGRSQRAVAALEKVGAKKIYHLDGGFRSWIHNEFAVEATK